VDQDIDPAPCPNDRVDHPLASRLIPNVLGEEKALASGSSDKRFGGLGVALFLGKVHDRDLSTDHEGDDSD